MGSQINANPLIISHAPFLLEQGMIVSNHLRVFIYRTLGSVLIYQELEN